MTCIQCERRAVLTFRDMPFCLAHYKQADPGFFKEVR